MTDPRHPSERLDRRTLLARAGAGAAALALPLGGVALGDDDDRLFRRDGTDPTFQELVNSKAFPIGRQSTAGVKGSTIHINHKRLSEAPNSDKPVPGNIRLHTLCHSHIKPSDFAKWTRWYQEDASTQVFRLFRGEHNVRNGRKNAARVEAFSDLAWTKGPWHAWQGTYTIVQPHGAMIFQVKNDDNDWAVSIGLSSNGEVKLNRRRGKDETLARNMIGKSFILGVRDNGHDYEVYYNKRKVGEGAFDRPKGKTKFRWGMYLGNNEMRHDAMLFVTGVRFE